MHFATLQLKVHTRCALFALAFAGANGCCFNHCNAGDVSFFAAVEFAPDQVAAKLNTKAVTVLNSGVSYGAEQVNQGNGTARTTERLIFDAQIGTETDWFRLSIECLPPVANAPFPGDEVLSFAALCASHIAGDSKDAVHFVCEAKQSEGTIRLQQRELVGGPAQLQAAGSSGAATLQFEIKSLKIECKSADSLRVIDLATAPTAVELNGIWQITGCGCA